MLRAVLLEWDGVLAATAALRRAAFSDALADDGATLDEETWTRAGAGRDGADAARRLRDALDLPHDHVGVELLRLRAERAFCARLARGVTLAPGALAALDALGQAFRLAIVSRATRRETELFLTAAQCTDRFATVVTADDVRRLPPDAEAPRRAIERLQRGGAFAPANAVTLADGEAALRAARAAGTRVIAVGEFAAEVAVLADGWCAGVGDLDPDTVRRLVHGRAAPAP
jgi:beta-phosphoglucomutase-like phosphatase (HAD superfamily)